MLDPKNNLVPSDFNINPELGLLQLKLPKDSMILIFLCVCCFFFLRQVSPLGHSENYRARENHSDITLSANNDAKPKLYNRRVNI